RTARRRAGARRDDFLAAVTAETSVGGRPPDPGQMHATLPLTRRYGFPALRRRQLETLQVNLGYKCNQSCLHCHVNAGPTRTEMMSHETLSDVLVFLKI